jgi:hypothetical protein
MQGETPNLALHGMGSASADAMGIIEEILEACASSARADRLILNQKKGLFPVRAQLHVQLCLPFAGGKTTAIVALPKNRFHVLTEYTLPGMCGTIGKDGRPVMGEVIKCAGKCAGLDEFQKYSLKCKEALLNLLEQQFYNRNLGYASMAGISKSTKYYSVSLKAGDNTMRITSRFSCLTTSMIKPNVQAIARSSAGLAEKTTEYAFMSRFVPINLNLNLQDMYKVIRGEPVFEISRVHEYGSTPVFEDYLKMTYEHEKIANGLPFLDNFEPDKFGFVSRNCLDVARLAAFSSRGAGSVTDWQKWLNYVPWMLWNYVSATLSLNEYKVLNWVVLDDLEQSEMAKRLEVSESYVSKTVSLLRGLGLIIKPEKLALDGNVGELKS